MTALRKLREKVAAGRYQPGQSASVFPPENAYGHCTFMDFDEAYTGSLNAAKALHEALLPGWGWHCGVYGARTWEYPGDEWHPERRSDVEMPENPARAWLLAILDALIQKETDDAD